MSLSSFAVAARLSHSQRETLHSLVVVRYLSLSKYRGALAVARCAIVHIASHGPLHILLSAPHVALAKLLDSDSMDYPRRMGDHAGAKRGVL